MFPSKAGVLSPFVSGHLIYATCLSLLQNTAKGLIANVIWNLPIFRRWVTQNLAPFSSVARQWPRTRLTLQDIAPLQFGKEITGIHRVAFLVLFDRNCPKSCKSGCHFCCTGSSRQ